MQDLAINSQELVFLCTGDFKQSDGFDKVTIKAPGRIVLSSGTFRYIQKTEDTRVVCVSGHH